MGKTPWDWMNLLIVPVMLVGPTAYFTYLQQRSQNEAQRDLEVAKANIQGVLEQERAPDAALQAYLEQMSALITSSGDGQGLSAPEAALAQAWTLTVLRSLDGDGKRIVVTFLYDAGWIDSEPVVNLLGADLSNSELSDANLSGANLSGANLSKAFFWRANLSGANLNGVEGVTNEKLEQQADSLEGATMPNGQKYEDWLKDKEGR